MDGTALHAVFDVQAGTSGPYDYKRLYACMDSGLTRIITIRRCLRLYIIGTGSCPSPGDPIRRRFEMAHEVVRGRKFWAQFVIGQAV